MKYLCLLIGVLIAQIASALPSDYTQGEVNSMYVRGNSLDGNFDCRLTNILNNKTQNLRLELRGIQNHYNADFYNDRKKVISAEGVYDPDFSPDRLDLSYTHIVERHTGSMSFNVSNKSRNFTGHIFNPLGFRFYSIKCSKI